MIRNWELFFWVGYGHENRSTVMEAFVDFMRNDAKTLTIPGRCMLGGLVYGSEKFSDGGEIYTSNLCFIERLERGKLGEDGFSNDLMCATTASGSKYYFYAGNHNAYMALMIKDLREGVINPAQHHYLRPDCRNPELL